MTSQWWPMSPTLNTVFNNGLQGPVGPTGILCDFSDLFSRPPPPARCAAATLASLLFLPRARPFHSLLSRPQVLFL